MGCYIARPDSRCDFTGGSLTLKGKVSLTSTQSDAVFATYDVTVEDGSDITALSTADTESGIRSWYGPITIEGARQHTASIPLVAHTEGALAKTAAQKLSGAAKYRFFVRKGTGSWAKAGDSATNIFTWKKAPGVTGYEVQYALKASFIGAKKVTVKKAATPSAVIKNLSKGKTYYVRIRTYTTKNGKTTYSAWSGAKSLKLTK